MMNRITDLIGNAGVDSPELVSPFDIIDLFVRNAEAYSKAETRYNEAVADLTDDELKDPTVEVSTRLERLEGRYSALMTQRQNLEPLVMKILERSGCGVNRGGVVVNGVLILMVQDMMAHEPTITLVRLADIRNLNVVRSRLNRSNLARYKILKLYGARSELHRTIRANLHRDPGNPFKLSWSRSVC